MSKTLPKWATRLIGAVLLVAAYLAHTTGVIPATLVWQVGPVPLHVLALLNDVGILGAWLGLSGPALWPRLAAVLGNPSAGAVNDAAKALDQPVPTAKT